MVTDLFVNVLLFVVVQGKIEQVMQLTAQRNSAKNRADSLAKDLSRVYGSGRTVDIVAK